MTSEESKAWFDENNKRTFKENGFGYLVYSGVAAEEQRYQAFKRRFLDEMGSEEDVVPI